MILVKIEKNGCVLFLNIPSFPILVRNAVCSGGGWFVCGFVWRVVCVGGCIVGEGGLCVGCVGGFGSICGNMMGVRPYLQHIYVG